MFAGGVLLLPVPGAFQIRSTQFPIIIKLIRRILTVGYIFESKARPRLFNKTEVSPQRRP